jgi:hypothetical protein
LRDWNGYNQEDYIVRYRTTNQNIQYFFYSFFTEKIRQIISQNKKKLLNKHRLTLTNKNWKSMNQQLSMRRSSIQIARVKLSILGIFYQDVRIQCQDQCNLHSRSRTLRDTGYLPLFFTSKWILQKSKTMNQLMLRISTNQSISHTKSGNIIFSGLSRMS